MATARINMQHGFMKSIIRNQVERDNYDREVKSKDQVPVPKSRPQKDRCKKPELQVYVPPCMKKENLQQMFLLEFEDRNGQMHRVDVFKNDSADVIAQQLGSTCNLQSAYISALAHRIQQEMDKRL